MSKPPAIKATTPVVPMIYAYSTPQIADHDGWVKIGYTEAKTTGARQKEQAHTVDVKVIEEWKGRAVYEDESGESFTDRDFHRYLKRLGVERKPSTEWFHVSGSESRNMFHDFRSNRGLVGSTDIVPYALRKEQADAVRQTLAYAADHTGSEFLWNAKPRFGKTLAAYDLVKSMGAINILIVTNRPAIANSWYSDYEQFLGRQSGYIFISNTDALKDKPLVYTREEFSNLAPDMREDVAGVIEFVSLQDLKGGKLFGGRHDKLSHIQEINWDVLVVDEAHEGVDTCKTDVAFDRIKRKFTLHLSGTPFKAIANDKFEASAIFNWTYADEQKAKKDAAGTEDNQYEILPQLNLFTYRMSDVVAEDVAQGMELDGEKVEYAFDLNEFFKTEGERFVHEEAVDQFLNAMVSQNKFPFSTPELRDELRHTFWLLNRVDSARALAKKLHAHPIFKDYEIILAAGDGKLDDAEAANKSYDKVRKTLDAGAERTITLSVGQLTTGVTVPEWTAVMMLCNMQSPSLYMQAAFRAQNPHLFYRGKSKDGKDLYLRKDNAYVFDFDPARTLTIFEQFANDLASETSNGRGSSADRTCKVRELLNFFPVIGEDDNGEMIELDAEQVLSIPRKIRSQEVVKRGFMSDFLFQNISNVFRAPSAVLDILQQFEPQKEPKRKIELEPGTAEKYDLDPNGEINPSDEKVIGTVAEAFGDKKYGFSADEIEEAIDEEYDKPNTRRNLMSEDPRLKWIKDALGAGLDQLETQAKDHYGNEVSRRERDRWRKRNAAIAERELQKAFENNRIDRSQIEEQCDRDLEKAENEAERQKLEAEAQSKLSGLNAQLAQELTAIQDDVIETAKRDLAKTVIEERDRKAVGAISDSIRDHLRGFSRTIPSFIMAYGDENLTLRNFETYVDDQVFKDVTSITLDQFRYLRDGGETTNPATGEVEHFAGELFDEVVFNDSVQEFLRKKRELANYYSEDHTEDIFSYIPPQKTNQIFTPKRIVQKMVDMLEQENPGCFDDPSATFADLYMKSGLYLAEIVKRLYKSDGMKKRYPDEHERIRHIVKEQVYGMAPTPIIYAIACNFVLGFDPHLAPEDHNLVQADAAQAAKHGTLQELIDSFWD